MKKTFLTMAAVTAAAAAALYLAPPSFAQDGPPQGGPPEGGRGFGGGRAGGGRGGRGGARGPVEPAGPMPKSPDGRPDFSGFWNLPERAGATGIEAAPPRAPGREGGRGGFGGRGGANPIIDPADGKIPYTPAARAKQEDLVKNHLAEEPELNCYESGVPHSESTRFGAQILMTPGYFVQLNEFLHTVRIIPIDPNRKHLDPSVHLFQGDPIGHWEGDSLVVDTTNQNDKTWFDLAGNFKTDNLHITEKFTPIDANTIQYEATMHDPDIYTQDWTARWDITRDRAAPNSDGHPHELMEFACIEGNRDPGHYTQDEGGKAKVERSSEKQ